MEVIACIENPQVIKKILMHLCGNSRVFISSNRGNAMTLYKALRGNLR